MLTKQPYLVGLTGGSASGKTRFLRELSMIFGEDEVCILSQDNYYKSAEHHVKDEQGNINYDLPGCIDLEKFANDIATLQSGSEIKIREYRFQHDEQFGHWITYKPAPIIIAEGLFIFYDERIRNQFQLKLFIDAHPETQYQRRLKRDTTERNIPAEYVKYQWDNHVLPAYNQYLLPYKELSDIIINNNVHFNNSLFVLTDHFKKIVSNTQQ